jgi:hypothetical protein
VTVQTAATSTHTNEAYTITRAYNDIQTWEDPCGATPCLPSSSGGRGGDLVSRSGGGRGGLQDGVFSPTTGTTILGSTTDATRYMSVTVADGQRHNGVAGTGVIIDATGVTTGSLFHVRDPYFRLEWLEMRNYPGDLTTGQVIQVEEAEAPGTYLAYLLIHDYTDNIRGAINTRHTTVHNSIIYNGPPASGPSGSTTASPSRT